MPIQVDLSARRAAIADATIRVALHAGLQGVTIRAVAAELGASTTFITNYLPTRSALLVNALRRIEAQWLDELEAQMDADAAASLRRVVRAAVDWDADELLRAQFWVAVMAVAERDTEVDRHLVNATTAFRAVFAGLVERCGHPHPNLAADILVMVAQGAFASIVETPGLWDRRRLLAVADAVVDAVLGDC